MANLFPSVASLFDQRMLGFAVTVAIAVLFVDFVRAERQIFVIIFANIARAVIQTFRFDIVMMCWRRIATFIPMHYACVLIRIICSDEIIVVDDVVVIVGLYELHLLIG